MKENFIATIQARNRISIPIEYIYVLKLKKGDRVRIHIHKIRKRG